MDDAGIDFPEDYFIYHESQTAALCGVHAINTLLQGPYVDEVVCADIAHQLDAQEHALMAEAGMESAEFLNFVAEESANVSASGMFSIQVLSKALEMWGLHLVPLNSPDAGDARSQPQNYSAFICNLDEHWFTIRKIHSDWWNLNSLFSCPEPLSPFYLEAFLGSLQQQGYTIFLVQGNLMEPDIGGGIGSNGGGRWISADEARQESKNKQELKKSGFLKAAASNLSALASAAGEKIKLRPRGASTRAGQRAGESSALMDLSSDAHQDADLQRALAASRQDMYMSDGTMAGSTLGGTAGTATGIEDEDLDLAAAIAASLAEAHQPMNPSSTSQPPVLSSGYEDSGGAGTSAEVPGHQAVLAQHGTASAFKEESLIINPASADVPNLLPNLPVLESEPSATEEGVLEIGLKLLNGERRSRRFTSEDRVGHLAAFAVDCGVDMTRHRLATTFPRRLLEDLEKGLIAAGVGNKDLVIVEALTR